MEDTYEIDVHKLDATCDELWLLLDTALHNGFHRGDAEIREHIRGCEACFDVNSEVL